MKKQFFILFFLTCLSKGNNMRNTIYSNIEITSFRNDKGAGVLTAEQINELHAIPNCIVVTHYKQDGKDVFTLKSIIGVITVLTNNKDVVNIFETCKKDNVVVNLLSSLGDEEPQKHNTPKKCSKIIDYLDFGVEFNVEQLNKLKIAPNAVVDNLERFDITEGVYASMVYFDTVIGRYNAIVRDKMVSIKLATAMINESAVNLFEDYIQS